MEQSLWRGIWRTARCWRIRSSWAVRWVMHFAARIDVGESMKRPEIYFRNNTASTLSLLEAMLALGHNRRVFSSTAALWSRRRLRYWRIQT